MNTKTSIAILGIIIVIALVVILAKPKNSTTNPDNVDSVSIINDEATDETTNENAADVTPGMTASEDLEDPAFPTTGFAPTN